MTDSKPHDPNGEADGLRGRIELARRRGVGHAATLETIFP